MKQEFSGGGLRLTVSHDEVWVLELGMSALILPCTPRSVMPAHGTSELSYITGHRNHLKVLFDRQVMPGKFLSFGVSGAVAEADLG